MFCGLTSSSRARCKPTANSNHKMMCTKDRKQQQEGSERKRKDAESGRHKCTGREFGSAHRRNWSVTTPRGCPFTLTVAPILTPSNTRYLHDDDAHVNAKSARAVQSTRHLASKVFCPTLGGALQHCTMGSPISHWIGLERQPRKMTKKGVYSFSQGGRGRGGQRRQRGLGQLELRGVGPHVGIPNARVQPVQLVPACHTHA
jgi:hypothetical protein